MIDTFLFLLVDGLTSGLVYALLALSLVLVFTVTRVVNIAQGEYVMLGALTLADLLQGRAPGTLYLLAGGTVLCLILDADRWRRDWRAALGIAAAGAVNLLDPAGVVLGGGYARLAPWLLPAMRRELASRVTVRPWAEDRLTVSRLGRRGPLLGAAVGVVRAIVADPGPLTGG